MFACQVVPEQRTSVRYGCLSYSGAGNSKSGQHSSFARASSSFRFYPRVQQSNKNTRKQRSMNSLGGPMEIGWVIKMEISLQLTAPEQERDGLNVKLDD